MESYGLKGSNVTCLVFLGQSPEGLTAAELCERCMEDKAGISKSLAALKEKGFIDREENKKYKGKYFISDTGMKIVNKLNSTINNVVEDAGNGFSNSERTVFYNVFEKIVSNLAEICSERGI